MEAAKKETAIARRLDPQGLMEMAVQNNASVETLERLFSLATQVKAAQAKEAWNQAMSEFQKDCPKIVKSSMAKIQTRSGGAFSYHYASLENIMAAIVPRMTALGMSISWRNRIENGRVIASCRVSHDMGHFEESGEVAMPVTEDAHGANPAQRVGIAMTYAKRYSLLSIVGLAPEDDPDAAGLDEQEPRRERPEPTSAPERSDADESYTGDTISEAQHKRMWAMAFSQAKKQGMDEEWAKTKLINLVRDHGFGSTKKVTLDKYKAICNDLEAPF